MYAQWYSPALRVFIKISRKWDHALVFYVSDSYLKADTYRICLENVLDTINNILRELRVLIRPKKSIFTPTQTIFGDILIHEKNITWVVTDKKKTKIKTLTSLSIFQL